MKIETSKKNVCIKKIITREIKKIELNEDVIIPDIKPDILKPIDESGNICIYKKEVLDGKIKIDGTVNIYLIYLADSEKENIRGINTTIDFKEIFDCKEAKDTMKLEEKLKIKSIDCRVLNGRKISIRVEIEATIVLYINEYINIVNNIENVEDVQKIIKKVKINSNIGYNTAKTYAKETIKIEQSDELAEILKLDVNIINKDTKVSYNKVLAKADAEVKIMYLTEDNRIRNIDEKIPIMGFIEMTNISENDICDVSYTIKNILVKPNSEDEHSIYVEIELELTCNAFNEENIEIIEDLYSPNRNLNYISNNIKTIVKKENKDAIYDIKEKVQIQELPGERVHNISLEPVLNKAKISNDKILFEGDLKTDIMLSANNESTIELVTKNIPFMYEMGYDGITEDSKIDVNIYASMQNFKVEDSNIEINATLCFEVSRFEELNLNIIEDVTEDENECESSPYSMTIYFVKQGDSLWKIAKKFKSTVDAIAKLNDIEETGKIDIGMQLFIPKYVCVKENG